MRKIVEQYVFGPEKNRAKIYKKVKSKALRAGIFLASISLLYKEIAKGSITGFSVPAFNMRTLSFDMASSIFKTAKELKASAFIIEAASSEMDYTHQSPEEFALCVLGAAIKEKYKGPVFLQGDHFPPSQDLILKSLNVGFYNFDIDCSALNLEDNIKQTNNFIEFIKKNQPQGIEVAVGGEVSSIGGEETTPNQLEDFLKKVQGLTKVSCQTGTRHGGKVLASGAIAKVDIDYENIKNLGEVAKQYGLAGIVQHGASTLQESQFTELTKARVLEVHLSTLFQNIILDSKNFPGDLRNRMYSLIEKSCSIQAKKYETNIQFLQIFRKKAFGAFKKEIWQMPKKNIKGIKKELEEKFLFFFKVFGVTNTKDLVDKIYT